MHSRNFKKFHIFKDIKTFNQHYFIDLIKVGLPMGFMHVVELSTFAILTFWIARFGTTMLAAHQIVLQYLGFAITIVFAMSQAVTVRVGNSVGKRDITGIYYASFVGMLLNSAGIFCIAILFYAIPSVFLQLDINVHNKIFAPLVRDASTLLGIAALLLIFDNLRIVGFGALRGLKDTRSPLYSAIVGFWIVGLTLSYLFAFIWQKGGPGIWFGLTIGIAVGAAIVLIRLYYLLTHLLQHGLIDK